MKIKIENLLDETTKNLDDKVNDFLSTVDLDRANYLCDLMAEFADTNTDIYNKDLLKFLNENVEKVENAIDNYGWQGDLFKSISYAEYDFILDKLNENIKQIVFCLALVYLNKKLDFVDLAKIDELDKILLDFDSNNRIDEIIDEVDKIFNLK